MTIKLYLLPDFKDIDHANDILNRICWGLLGLPSGEAILSVNFEVTSGILIRPDRLGSISLPVSQESYLSGLPSIIDMENNKVLDSESFEIYWDSVSYFDQKTVEWEKHRLLIDPYYLFNREADQVAALQYSLLNNGQRILLENDCLSKYKEFQDRWSGVKDAYLYLTGPTVESVQEQSVDKNGLKIICNSLVKNISLLQHIQPNVLMFSDPAYHFGVSKYAASFRKFVMEAMLFFPDLLCIVPERYYPLTSAFLGKEFSQRILGMPIVIMDKFNFPTIKEFFVRKTENILSLLMIPIASSVTSTIHITGADGRRKNDNGYWAHAKTSQISDLLKTIYETHPSLARDECVENYYKEHCLQLEELLNYGETIHQKVYYCQSQSIIPALAKRMAAEY